MYAGPIKLVILDIAGTVCDGHQDLSHLYSNDDGRAVKGPVIAFEQIFQKYKIKLPITDYRLPVTLLLQKHLKGFPFFFG